MVPVGSYLGFSHIRKVELSNTLLTTLHPQIYYINLIYLYWYEIFCINYISHISFISIEWVENPAEDMLLNRL